MSEVKARAAAGRLAVLGLALLAGCGGEPQDGPDGRSGPGGSLAMGGAADRAIPVAVEVIAPRDLQVMLRGSANLRARQRVDVLPKQGGVIARILVEEGTPVREGQPLALLDDEQWALQARQSTARARAAQDALERAQALQDRGLLADQEVERLRSDAEVAAADAALAELTLQNATIAAPLAGVVTHRNVEQGQLVGTSTVAFTVADLGRLEADVGVPEREALRVQRDQPVEIRAEGLGAALTGQVTRIRPVVDPASGTVQVTVEVDPQQGGGLRAGQFVNVDIVTEVLEDRLTLPRTAVLVDGPLPRVYRVVDGYAEELTVTVGGSHGDRVEIRGGVREGDTVVVVGQENLRPQAAVLIMEVDGSLVTDPRPPVGLPGQPGADREALEAGFIERGMSAEEASRAAAAAARGDRPAGEQGRSRELGRAPPRGGGPGAAAPPGGGG